MSPLLSVFGSFGFTHLNCGFLLFFFFLFVVFQEAGSSWFITESPVSVLLLFVE